MTKTSRIQSQHVDIEWRRFRDMDTYYAPRDDRIAEQQTGRRRQYAVRWCVEAKQVQSALDQRQKAIAAHVRTLHLRTQDKARTSFEFVDGNRSFNAAEQKRLRRLDEKHELAGFEAVAGQLPGGRQCFHAIIEGDSLEALKLRCDVNWRGAVGLIGDVLRALEIYHGFNEVDAARNNARTA